jgi:hypothetical protein
MVIVHEYPFNCVTHHFLRVFLSDLQPQFKLVSRNILRVSFTSDLWTSNSRDRGFMALTCHYIDDD